MYFVAILYFSVVTLSLFMVVLSLCGHFVRLCCHFSCSVPLCGHFASLCAAASLFGVVLCISASCLLCSHTVHSFRLRRPMDLRGKL